MLTKTVLIGGLLFCSACASRDKEVIRHLVIAELAERQSEEPSHIEVTSVEIQSASEATAKAEYSPRGSRGPERIKVTCHLTRKQDRWQVEACAPAG